MVDGVDEAPAIRFPKKIEMWEVGKLVPYARNPRFHSDEEVAELADQIVKRGWTNPILVDEEAGILAGHRRLKAAQLLGLKRVPVIVISGLSEAEKKALIIADNQTTLHGGWSKEILLEELQAIRDAGLDYTDAAFSIEEINALERDPLFNPAFDPAMDHRDVSARDIDATGRRLDNQFVRNQDLTHIVCPHCGEEFWVDPEEMKVVKGNE